MWVALVEVDVKVVLDALARAVTWRDGWIGGRCVRCMRYGRIGRRRDKVRGVYGFSSLVKQNKKGKNCAVLCFAGFFF